MSTLRETVNQYSAAKEEVPVILAHVARIKNHHPFIAKHILINQQKKRSKPARWMHSTPLGLANPKSKHYSVSIKEQFIENDCRTILQHDSG